MKEGRMLVKKINMRTKDKKGLNWQQQALHCHLPVHRCHHLRYISFLLNSFSLLKFLVMEFEMRDPYHGCKKRGINF